MSQRNPSPKFSGKAVTISCTDRERTENFYAHVLGAELIPGDGYGCQWYRLDSLTISVMPNAEHKSPATFPDHAMPVFWLEVDDIHLAHEHLANAGTPIIQPPDDDMFMLIADPDGLVIEVWQKEI